MFLLCCWVLKCNLLTDNRNAFAIPDDLSLAAVFLISAGRTSPATTDFIETRLAVVTSHANKCKRLRSFIASFLSGPEEIRTPAAWVQTRNLTIRLQAQMG